MAPLGKASPGSTPQDLEEDTEAYSPVAGRPKKPDTQQIKRGSEKRAPPKERASAAATAGARSTSSKSRRKPSR